MSKAPLRFAALVLAVSAPAFAQQPQPAPQPTAAQPSAPPREGSVNNRRADQQNRIANGVQSGQLTAGESKNLESREANVNREIHADRSANGGTLTPQERQQVNRQQNNLSHSIYQDKHNANQAHFGNNEVGQRRENQQDRIAQGIRSGQMTAGEAARTEGCEQNINQRQNSSNRQIYRQKRVGDTKVETCLNHRESCKVRAYWYFGRPGLYFTHSTDGSPGQMDQNRAEFARKSTRQSRIPSHLHFYVAHPPEAQRRTRTKIGCASASAVFTWEPVC